MRRDPFLQGLLELHTLRDPQTRRAAWRSSVAGIARACAEDRPSPLEGLSPGPIAESVKIALSTGLIDDLDWLAPASAGAALYEIASALPAGPEKRELGRRTLSRLFDGDAATFVALATRMALGAGKGLSGEAVRARVALVSALPPSAGVRVDPLALALAGRRELAREWIGEAAAGSLPDRRMAARLVEHAARGVALRMAQGDDAAMRVLRGEAVANAQARLFEDREPLVWRHIAVARGLLAAYHPPFMELIEQGFAPELSPMEWRRSATSLVAFAAARPDAAVKKVRDVLLKGALRRDPGAAAAFLWGVPAAAEVEPEAAEEIIDAVLAHAPASAAAEALGEVLLAGPTGRAGKFGMRAAEVLRGVLGRAASGPTDDVDDGALALKTRLADEMGPEDERERSLAEAIRAGTLAFATGGAKPAFAAGIEALTMATSGFATLAALGDDGQGGRAGSIARRTAFLALRELDLGLFEDGLLRDLLLLGGRAPESQRAVTELEQLTHQISDWILLREQEPVPRTSKVTHPTIRLRRLRTLLHIADARSDEAEAPPSGTAPPSADTRALCLRIATLSLRLLAAGPPPVLTRTIGATFARATDALLRADVCDPADVLLVVARKALPAADVDTLFEASMNEDLRVLLRGWARLVRAAEASVVSTTASELITSEIISFAPGSMPPVSVEPPAPSSLPPISLASSAGRRTSALLAFARELPPEASPRAEAMRTAVMRIARALVRIHAATSLGDLSGASSPLQDLENGILALAQLCAGARQRFGDRDDAGFASPGKALSSAVDAAARGLPGERVGDAVATLREEVAILLPSIVAEAIGDVLEPIASLPAASAVHAGPQAEPEPPLPTWLPARRTIGGFYVVRALGSGTGGTVLIARRIEDRHDPDAERFALKVPAYDEAAARSLSEEEFLKLFREEASALLGLPEHPNLAHFVTFDLSSRPKPILVMELVEGLSLDRAIRSGALDTKRAFDILDGVLSGLEAMHRAGIGHLDVKPSNVILRGVDEPVLVDFGLAGRHIRPGCATLAYGAPEVWGVAYTNFTPTPPPADVYAFGCLMHEVLTSFELFDGDTEMAVITAHVTHDGNPKALERFREVPENRPVADLITRCIRRDPRERASVEQIRSALRVLAREQSKRPWPLSAMRRA